MNRNLTSLILIAAFVFSACDSSNVVDPDSTTTQSISVDWLQVDLDLNAEQVKGLELIVSEMQSADHAERQSKSWEIAYYLQTALTPSQKSTLIESTDDAVSGKPERVRRRDGKHGLREDSRRPMDSVLSEEQKELVSTHREEMKSMIREFRSDGSIDETEREKLKTSQADFRERLKSTLTPEQQNELSARGAKQRGERRGLNRKVLRQKHSQTLEFLNLSDDQREQIATLRNERKELGEELKSHDIGERRSAIAAHRQESMEALKTILTSEQVELLELHRALTSKLRTQRKSSR